MSKPIVFVFGSNYMGIHGAGAARTAYIKYGAEMGVGKGISGHSYAIPTKLRPTRQKRQLALATLSTYVTVFLCFAEAHQEFDYKVTRVGTGLAGYTDDEMAKMFQGAPSNCYFDPYWAMKYGYQPWREDM